jgi:LysR family glycine cleavage system transcriptional activator
MQAGTTERLPPLTALRAFEAAGRHLSFANAAAELHVTPAALSQQIKSLEAHLGAAVFRRLNRRVELTDIGRSLMPGLSDGFEALQTAWAGAVRRLSKQHLTVTAGPAFMASWLAPRMARFVTAHPDIELRFTASLRMLNFERDEIDLAVRFGRGDDAGYFSEELFVDWATPMVAPELAARLKQPADIFSLPMIGQDSSGKLAQYEQWDAWCAALDLDVSKAHGPVFTTPDAALTFAENGGGVVLGRITLAEHLLRAGRLVAPLPYAIRRDLRHRLVCPAGIERAPNVIAFREWIRHEMAALASWSEGRVFI